MGKTFDWLERVFGVIGPHRGFFKRRIPDTVNYSHCFGGMAFAFFLILVLTGLLLSVYYIPSEKEAYRSIVMITEEIPLGWLVRSLHKWSASLFIVCILLHTARVVIHKAYRSPRELNWMAGVFALVCTMGSGFTGYLLPWDQKAYWATEVGTSMAKTVPFIGEYLLLMVRGGTEVTGATLIRFYSFHILYLPFALSLLLWAHFHMVKRQGIARPL